MQKIFSSWKKRQKVCHPVRLSRELNCDAREAPKAVADLAVSTTTIRDTAAHPLRQPMA
ncbi:MAG: hypothetical protein K2Q28_04535 [Hyphomicrobium sp.]|nr:hypothetical protein [Hyphomicrobium sp.]